MYVYFAVKYFVFKNMSGEETVKLYSMMISYVATALEKTPKKHNKNCIAKRRNWPSHENVSIYSPFTLNGRKPKVNTFAARLYVCGW